MADQGLSFADLTRLRDKTAPGDPMQSVFAPLEHRAYARETTRENPLNALANAIGIPAWQLAKMLGLMRARTPPAMDQVWGGYTGIMEGLRDRWQQPPQQGVLSRY